MLFAALFLCLAVYLAIAPLLFVKGTLRLEKTYSRETIKMVHAGIKQPMVRVPAGTEKVWDMDICDSNGNVVTVVTTNYAPDVPDTKDTNGVQSEDIVYLPMWPYFYASPSDHIYGPFVFMALIFAVISFAAFWLAMKLKKEKAPQDDEADTQLKLAGWKARAPSTQSRNSG